MVFRDQESHILKPGDSIRKGEIVLVNLYLSNKFDRHFVVVDDTVPGGVEAVNFELGTASRYVRSLEGERDVLP